MRYSRENYIHLAPSRAKFRRNRMYIFIISERIAISQLLLVYFSFKKFVLSGYSVEHRILPKSNPMEQCEDL